MRFHTHPQKPLACLLLSLLALPPLPAGAGVVGENVIAGEAQFERAGDVTTIHASDGAIIEYDALDVWSHEELHFVQPDSQSRVLNQVRGEATHIDGGLYANGIVYILNPAGVFFGGEAVVEVSGLVAAAGHMESADFLSGVDRFELSGPVENRGAVEARSVALLGRRVANLGSIRAPEGTIALVAGSRVLMTRPGAHLHVEVEGPADDSAGAALEQAGEVRGDSVSFTAGDVYSLALNHSGITRGRSIELRANSGGVRVAGQLDASARDAGARGGEIRVTGERVELAGAQLDASGAAGGGEILVGGDLRGAGPLKNARRTFVDADSRLSADALESGDGGRVIVWSDEATGFLGQLSARGGEAGGDGGFAEISGALFLLAEGEVDLSAARGTAGTLLFDPQDIELVGGDADGSDAPDLLSDRLAGDGDLAGSILEGDLGNLDQPFLIFVSELEGTDADIVLEATNSIFSSQTLDVTLQPDNSLSLTTRNASGDDAGSARAPGIDLADVSFTTSGSGGISLETGSAADAAVTADLRVGSLDTAGGEIFLETANGAIDVAGDLRTSSGTGDGGAIRVRAGDLDGAGDSPIQIAGLVDADGAAGADGGAIELATLGSPQPFAGGNNDPLTGGGAISVTGPITARGGDDPVDGGAGGDVSISADGGAISANDIDTRGGDGANNNGGAAGAITLATRATDFGDPVESSDANDIDAGALLALGGNGGSGRGGAGGAVTLQTAASEEVTQDDPDDPVLREADGGGAIRVASVRTDGGAAADGGAGGSIDLGAAGEATAIDVAGALTSRGGAGLDGAGGAGGAVDVTTEDGAISHGAESLLVEGAPRDVSILTDGGSGTTAGGAGGSIRVVATDEDGDGDGISDGESPVAIGGDLVSRGGAGATGAGGAGGSVFVRSVGVRVDVETFNLGENEVIVTGGVPGRTPVRGGGDLALVEVDSRGGDGAATGGAGGGVTLLTSEGTITGADIDASGGAGADQGGSGGDMNIASADTSQDDGDDIQLGRLVSEGGASAGGVGGAGGSVDLRVVPAEEVIVEETIDPGLPSEMVVETVIQEAVGAGNIALPEGVWVDGGDGATRGGSGGGVSIGIEGRAAGAGTPSLVVGGAATPAVSAVGGQGAEAGGAGSRSGVDVSTAAADVTLGEILTTGGDATGADALGGNGGAVLIGAGLDPDAPAGSLLLLGNIDAREGASTVVLLDPGDPNFGSADADADRARVAGVDGGRVELFGEDDLEHGGQAGPHVRTTGDVLLGSQGDVGATGTWLVEGEGERRVVQGRFADTDRLSVGAGGRADVQVVNGGSFLAGLEVIAFDTGAALDIDVLQPGAVGDDRVSIDGQGGRAVVTEADGTGHQIDLFVRYQNRDTDSRDDATLVLGTGAVLAGAAFEATSDGDLVIGDGDGVVIEAGTLLEPDPIPAPAPGDEPTPEGAPVTLVADSDADGTGAVLDALGGAVGRIDLQRDLQLPSRLTVTGAGASREAVGATAGVGEFGAPLVISEGGVVEEAVVSPLMEAADFDPERPVFEPDPGSMAGIYISGEGPEELEVNVAEVEAGMGDIELTAAGDLRISGGLETQPDDPDLVRDGGDILLQSGPGSRIVLAPFSALAAGGRQTWDGPVLLERSVTAFAGAGLEATGAIDSAVDTANSLFAVVGGDSTFSGDIGASVPLGFLSVTPIDDSADPTLNLQLAAATTELAQLYGVDVALEGDVAFVSDEAVFFDRSLDAAGGADAAADVQAGLLASFGGDVGVADALRGLTVKTEEGGLIQFEADGAQRVVTETEGIRLDTGLSDRGRPRVPQIATLARVGGDLSLESQGGDVILAEGEKLTGTGNVSLVAPGGVAAFGDVNALGVFDVSAQTIRVLARPPGEVRLAGGGRIIDGGTDIFAADVDLQGGVFEIVDGGGAAPRIATPDGSATAPGPFEVVSLGEVLVEADVLPDGPGGIVLDLAIPEPSPGFETHELDQGPPIDSPEDLWTSGDEAASGSPSDPQQVARALACQAESRRGDCPQVAALPPGSPLATPRAAELAARLGELLGESHRAARRALADAAADSAGSLVNPETREYLLLLARWETQAGLLGLDDAGLEAARATLFEAVAGAVAAPGLDAERLRGAVERARLDRAI